MMENIFRFLTSPASFTAPGGFKIEGPVIWAIPTVMALLFGAIASLIWLFRDATKRDKNGFVALVFVLATGWPASFIWWFWLRPPVQAKD